MAEENLSLQLDMLEMADESNLDQHLVHDAEEHPQPSAENCNLIVNYLPHDIDDLSIKVSLWAVVQLVLFALNRPRLPGISPCRAYLSSLERLS